MVLPAAERRTGYFATSLQSIEERGIESVVAANVSTTAMTCTWSR
jgi:hypothetical protein